MEFIEKVKRDPGANEIVRDYRFDRFLGKGGYGQVFEAFCHLEQKHYAIKIFKKSSVASSQSNRVQRNEVDMLKKMRHPNIIKIYQYRESIKYIFIVTELCQFGDLWKTL